MDGNFKAEHLQDRRPADDMFLMDGAGYMVSRGRYKEYLKVTHHPIEVNYVVLPSILLYDAFYIRNLHVTPIGRSTRQMPDTGNWRRPVSVLQRVLVMDALYLTVSLTSKKAKGMFSKTVC